MNDTTSQTTEPGSAPLDGGVRPRAWAWKDEPSGEEVLSGWNNPRPGLNSEPLYDQAAIDSAVAAERERCVAACESLDPSSWGESYGIQECVRAIRKA
jgi:hypothetical protein